MLFSYYIRNRGNGYPDLTKNVHFLHRNFHTQLKHINMLGLFLLYFIGKNFYNLAADHGRSEWGFAILGVVAYYVGTFIGGIVLVIAFELLSSTSIESMSDMAIGFMALPFGILSCVGLHYLLKGIWTKKPGFDPSIIDEIGRE